jgi:hypothetical protein
MSLTSYPARAVAWVIALAVLPAFAIAAPLPPAGTPAEPSRSPPGGRPVTTPSVGPSPVEVRLADDSTLKLTLLDERIELVTRYGKLLVPVADIRQIEFGLRLPPATARRIEAAVVDLGAVDYKRREAAAAELLALREVAYLAVLRAGKDSDPEVMRRAEEILAKLREAVAPEKLEVRDHDVVYTDDCKIAGRITDGALRVSTLPFGEQRLRLADVRGLRSLTGNAPAVEPAELLADPSMLLQLRDQVGKTYAVKITGALAGRWVWGTDIYSYDSDLTVAAVHGGLLKAGQTGTIKVTMLGPQAAFVGSTRHGVTTQGYGLYPGIRLAR